MRRRPHANRTICDRGRSGDAFRQFVLRDDLECIAQILAKVVRCRKRLPFLGGGS